MVKLNDYIEAIEGKVISSLADTDKISLNGAYVSDMLSDVMGSARAGQAWITIMKHLNVIAVASMVGVSCIVFAKDSIPDQAVIDKANEEEICLIISPKPVFDLAGILYKMLNN
ncbi:MAG: hypothetical protein U1C33_06595 [Candidatus Cloacimonadaceae bacterium]|nr:hypothetical protein [Candidatus Cloacimonadaceae bacterium]